MDSIGAQGAAAAVSLNQTDHLLGLPEELWIVIFSHLPISDIGHVRQVCRDWRNIGGDEQVWKRVAERLEPHLWGGIPTNFQQFVSQAAMSSRYLFDIHHMVHVDLETHTIEIRIQLTGSDEQVQNSFCRIVDHLPMAKDLLPPRSYAHAKIIMQLVNKEGHAFRVKGPDGEIGTKTNVVGTTDLLPDEKQKYLEKAVPSGDKENLGQYQEFAVLPYKAKA